MPFDNYFIVVLQYILVVLTQTAAYKTYDGDDVPAEIRPPATARSPSCSGGHGAARHDGQWEHRRLAKSEDEQRWTGTFFSTHYSDGSDAATACGQIRHLRMRSTSRAAWLHLKLHEAEKSWRRSLWCLQPGRINVREAVL